MGSIHSPKSCPHSLVSAVLSLHVVNTTLPTVRCDRLFSYVNPSMTVASESQLLPRPERFSCVVPLNALPTVRFTEDGIEGLITSKASTLGFLSNFVQI